MALALRDNAYHTYADYLAWPEDVRYELIDGMAYLMAPAPALEHQDIAGGNLLPTSALPGGQILPRFIAPVDVRLPKPKGDELDAQVDTVVQPDMLVVRDAGKLDRRGVRGAPDFVVEVLSPATASHDYLSKHHAYERAGVREYWLATAWRQRLILQPLNGRRWIPMPITAPGINSAAIRHLHEALDLLSQGNRVMALRHVAQAVGALIRTMPRCGAPCKDGHPCGSLAYWGRRSPYTGRCWTHREVAR